MDEGAREKHEGFEALQKNLLALVDALLDYARSRDRVG
jgi:hypothetical protein